MSDQEYRNNAMRDRLQQAGFNPPSQQTKTHNPRQNNQHGSYKPRVNRSRAPEGVQLPYLPRVSQMGEDGVDHINLSMQGATELGAALSFGFDLPFESEKFGAFPSVEAFYAWLVAETNQDDFRTARGHSIRYKLANYGITANVKNVAYLMAIATWEKITQNEKLLKAFYECDLEFESYYVRRTAVSSLRVRTDDACWFIPVMEMIHDHLIETECDIKNVPDFRFLIEDQAELNKLYSEYSGVKAATPFFKKVEKGQAKMSLNQPAFKIKPKKQPKPAQDKESQITDSSSVEVTTPEAVLMQTAPVEASVVESNPVVEMVEETDQDLPKVANSTDIVETVPAESQESPMHVSV